MGAERIRQANGTTTAVHRARNAAPIPRSVLPRFVRGKVSLVAYFLDAPRDVNGNALNRIAIRLDVALRHPENGLPSPGVALAPSKPTPSVTARIDPNNYQGAGFERIVADEIAFLDRHLAPSRGYPPATTRGEPT